MRKKSGKRDATSEKGDATIFYRKWLDWDKLGNTRKIVLNEKYLRPLLPLPSRYCESDSFYEMAAELTSGCRPGWNQVRAIVDHVARTIRYTPGSGSILRSARDVNGCSDAVCRDMTHLAIALTRALSIPARMVVGYLETLDPMDLHAWFEAFVGSVVHIRSDAGRSRWMSRRHSLWARRRGRSHLDAIRRSGTAHHDGGGCTTHECTAALSLAFH